MLFLFFAMTRSIGLQTLALTLLVMSLVGGLGFFARRTRNTDMSKRQGCYYPWRLLWHTPSF